MCVVSSAAFTPVLYTRTHIYTQDNVVLPLCLCASKSSKREKELFKIQQEREKEVLKIQQEREGGTQNPARERRSYSKSSKREKELFKIQQEREKELFKIQQESEGVIQNPARASERECEGGRWL